MIRVGLAFVALPSTFLYLGCSSQPSDAPSKTEPAPDTQPTGSGETTESTAKGNLMKVQYLEIVTPDVDAFCKTYSKLHGVTFGESDPNLGNARTGELAGGGKIGVRAPMRETENPVVRPYVLVDDIQAAVDAAAEAGAEIAIPPMEIPGQGRFAIFIQGGIESGLWQL
jgi:predicted enzyme related to lactoylglutathione lyase